MSFVIHLCPSFSPSAKGGAENNIPFLARSLFQRHKIRSYIFSRSLAFIIDNKYAVKRFRIFRTPLHKYFLLLSLSFRHDCKAIHVHSNGLDIFTAFFISLISSKKLIIKITRFSNESLVQLISDPSPFIAHIPPFSWFRLFIKRLFFKVILSSPYVYIQLLCDVSRFTSLPPWSKIILFPNLSVLPNIDHFSKVQNTFLITSRLIERKNVFLAIKLILQLPFKTQVLVAGDGPLFKKLKDLYGDNPNVILYGHLDKNALYNLYSRSEFYVNLSSSEGMSNSLIEALSFGCRCILSDILVNHLTAHTFASYLSFSPTVNQLLRSIEYLRTLDTNDISLFSCKYMSNTHNSPDPMLLYL